MTPPSAQGKYTQDEVDEIVANRLREQNGVLWERWVNARLAEFGELSERLERIEGQIERERLARRLFLQAWSVIMAVMIPIGTVILQHYVH